MLHIIRKKYSEHEIDYGEMTGCREGWRCHNTFLRVKKINRQCRDEKKMYVYCPKIVF